MKNTQHARTRRNLRSRHEVAREGRDFLLPGRDAVSPGTGQSPAGARLFLYYKQPPLTRCAWRIWKAIEVGGRKPNVLLGVCPSIEEFERAIGQLFLRGMVRWNGKTTARVLERRPA